MSAKIALLLYSRRAAIGGKQSALEVITKILSAGLYYLTQSYPMEGV